MGVARIRSLGHLIRFGKVCRAAAFATFVAFAALWARSYWMVDVAEVYWWSGEWKTYIQRGIGTDRGVLSISRQDWGNIGPYGVFRDGRPAIRLLWISSPVREPGSGGYAEQGLCDYWFNFQRLARRDGVIGDWELNIPLWAIEAVLALICLPAALRWERRRRRARGGLCPACGYDLRATADRCPECGAACKAADPAGVSPAGQNNRDGHGRSRLPA